MNITATVRLESVNGGDIVLAIINNPPVNTLDASVRAELNAALTKISEGKPPRALVLYCDGTTFISGADIKEFSGPPRAAEYRALFQRLEQLPCLVIAVLHGTVLGGGLELALACHYRIAVPETRVGLPEVNLGIIPGGGGTQRLPRLIGAESALDLMLSGRPIDADVAHQLGIIDEVIAAPPREAGIAYTQQLLNRGAMPRRTSALSVDPRSAEPSVFEAACERAQTEYPNRTAALRAVEAVEAAVQLPFEQGLDREFHILNETMQSVESRSLVHLFFAEREARKVPDIPVWVQPRTIKTVGIVGAGTMGGGIAIACANAGLTVSVLDANREALERGLAAVDKTYASMVKRARLKADEKARRMGRIRGVLDYSELAECDLFIEAVFEDMALKQRVLAEIDRVAKPRAVIASNTSTLDVQQLAYTISRPKEVIGLHFFSPANVMPLLEVVRTEDSSPEVVRTAMEFARLIKKTPVLARVCYGFIGNRMMEGYAREAERLVLEGETPRRVDSVIEEFGMAMGILAVFDMAGVDVNVKIHKANAERYPPDPTYYQAEVALYEAGRLGQKTGKGFYRYEPGERSRIDDPEAIELLQSRARALGIAQMRHDDQEIRERLLYPLLNEGFRILEERIAQRSGDIDVVWTAGYGFPRYRGGPMFYAETIGLPILLAGIQRYQERFGPMHWQPAPLLEQLVREGRSLADWELARSHSTGGRQPAIVNALF